MYINYNQLGAFTHPQILGDFKTFEDGGCRITVNERVKNRMEYQEGGIARQSRIDQYNFEESQDNLPLHANRMSPYYPRFTNNSNNSRFQTKQKSIKEQMQDEQKRNKQAPPNPNQFRINQSKIILQNGNYILCTSSNLLGGGNKSNLKLQINANSINSTKIKFMMQQKQFQMMNQKLKLEDQKDNVLEFDTKQAEFVSCEQQPAAIPVEANEVDTERLEERKDELLPDQKVKRQIVELKSPLNTFIATQKKVSNPKINKPQQQLVNDKDKIKMYNYFRHHLVSLLSIISKKEQYFEYLKDNRPLKIITESKGERKLTNQQLKYRDEVVGKIKKLLSTKGKYKYRERFNFMNSNQLKSLNYDVRKRLNGLIGNNKLQKCISKDELDDEDCSPKKKMTANTNITDMNTWKKRNNFNPEDKVYIVKGGYSVVKQGLDDRGWVENPDVFSPFFDLKWTIKLADLDFAALEESQIVNHFDNNLALTAKFGLCRSLKTLIWYEDSDIDTFYPRCYDLGDLTDFEDFIEDFKMNKAESILISFDNQQQQDLVSIAEEQTTPMRLGKSEDSKLTIKSDEHKYPLIESVKLRVAIMIIRRKLTDVIESLQQIIFDDCFPVVASDEWELIRDDCKKISNQKWSQKNILLAKEQLVHFDDAMEFQQHYEPIVKDLITQLKSREPQFNLNGFRNIWILKPNFLSRGRGIKCFNQIEKILDHIIGKETQYVIQKYMENPIIIKQKKFDIRQWVIVQDYDPPRVWFFDECYVRFSAEEFDIDNLSNRFIHLTNNSIAKNSGNFYQGDIKGNMWTQEEFASYLKEQAGEDVFYKTIQPMMKQIVILTVKSAQDQMKARKNSMELFGYDFMIDEHYSPWLIEINSSPSMDYSTHVTQRLVPIVLEDTLKVIIDYTLAKKGTKKQVDTGMFKLIYKGEGAQKQF